MAGNLKPRFVEKFNTLITAAFGLVAALAWNEAIQKIFETFFSAKNDVWAKLIYAVLVTALAVVVTYNVGKAADRINSYGKIKRK